MRISVHSDACATHKAVQRRVVGTRVSSLSRNAFRRGACVAQEWIPASRVCCPHVVIEHCPTIHCCLLSAASTAYISCSSSIPLVGLRHCEGGRHDRHRKSRLLVQTTISISQSGICTSFGYSCFRLRHQREPVENIEVSLTTDEFRSLPCRRSYRALSPGTTVSQWRSTCRPLRSLAIWRTR